MTAPTTASRRVERFKAWLPAALYMGLIWWLSSSDLPAFPTSAFPLRDKGVHIVEYGVLGFLLAHASLRTFVDRARVRVVLFAILLTTAWGLFDEIHQAFVPGRSADLLDLGADTIGAAFGALARGLLEKARPPRRANAIDQNPS